MITAGTQKQPILVEAGERAEMQISDVAKIFDMLSTGLYSNVPQSIAREICANASDAHADADCSDRPFDITFPTAFNPVFRVRDYGISLTHKQVMHLYTNLGESTKEGSNKGVGKFGIGSKAPFAYTDSFTVTTYLNGTKIFYSIVKEPVYKAIDPLKSDDDVIAYVRVNENGKASDGRVFEEFRPSGMIPAVYVMGEETTSQDNGVEVSFPIESRDVSKFSDAIQRVMFGFDIKPNVVDSAGEPDEQFSGWKELPVISEGKGWKLLSGNIEGYRGKAYAKMGCVLYPIDAESVDELDYDQKRMLEHTMIIEFPIGALDITPSRESLKYGRLSPSGPAIVKRLKGIITVMTKETLAVYEKCDTYWDACIKLREHMRANLPSVIRNAVRKEAKWDGITVQEAIKWQRNRFEPGLYGTVIQSSGLSNNVYRFSEAESISILPSKSVVIIIEDCFDKPTKRTASRIKYFYTQNTSDVTQIVWFKYRGGRGAQESLLKLLDRLDGATIIEAADLDEPLKNTITGSRRPVQVRVMAYGGFDEREDLSPEKFEAGGFYVPLERMEPVKPSYEYSTPHNIVNILVNLDKIPSGTIIYGAPKSLRKKFEGEQWINIYELADEVHATEFDIKAVKRNKALETVYNNATLQYMSKGIIEKILNADSPARTAIEFRLKAINTKKPEVDNMILLARAIGKRVDFDENDDSLITTLEGISADMEEKYPLISVLSYNCRHVTEALDKLTEYVLMCDTANATTNKKALAA